MISSVASSRVGRDLAWTFFQDNWDVFGQRFKGAFLLGRLVKSLTENFACYQKAKEIEDFFKVSFSQTESKGNAANPRVTIRKLGISRTCKFVIDDS